MILQAKCTVQEATIAQEVGYGIEEEGIPYAVEKEKGFSAEDVYHQAQRSPLGVCILVEDARIWLFARMLKENRPLFLMEIEQLAQAREMGKNAARVIKHRPFV